jgi:hypothetical protein
MLSLHVDVFQDVASLILVPLIENGNVEHFAKQLELEKLALHPAVVVHLLGSSHALKISLNVVVAHIAHDLGSASIEIIP